jgi:hypothetical protein
MEPLPFLRRFMLDASLARLLAAPQRWTPEKITHHQSLVRVLCSPTDSHCEVLDHKEHSVLVMFEKAGDATPAGMESI